MTNKKSFKTLNLENYESYFKDHYEDPHYFVIQNFPEYFSYGKNGFYIGYKNDPSNPKLTLRPGSDILIEAKDSMGHTIHSEIVYTDESLESGMSLVFIRLDEDPDRTYDMIQDGIGQLTIMGELHGESLPNQWKNTYNVKMVIPINIKKESVNRSILAYERQPTVEITEKLENDINDSYVMRSLSHFLVDDLDTVSGITKFSEIAYLPHSSSTNDKKILDSFEISGSTEVLRDRLSNALFTASSDTLGTANETNNYSEIGTFTEGSNVYWNWQHTNIGNLLTTVVSQSNVELENGLHFKKSALKSVYKTFRRANRDEEYIISYKVSSSKNADMMVLVNSSPLESEVTTSIQDTTLTQTTLYSQSFTNFNPNNSETWTSSYSDDGLRRSMIVSNSIDTPYITGSFTIPSESFATIWITAKYGTNNHFPSIADISIISKDDYGINPPVYFHKIKSPDERRNDLIDFEFRFKNPDNYTAHRVGSIDNVMVATASTTISGSPIVIEADHGILGGSLRSKGFKGFDSASAGTGPPGIHLYSGSTTLGGITGEYDDAVGFELIGPVNDDGHADSLKFNTETGRLEINGSVQIEGMITVVVLLVGGKLMMVI